MTNIVVETPTDRIEGKVLGQRVSAPKSYDPSILVAVPRQPDREKNKINLVVMNGNDRWYCYECSHLMPNGFPYHFTLGIEYDSDSDFIVESKSLKLYLNSFNNFRIPRAEFIEAVTVDLSFLLKTQVRIIQIPGIVDPQVQGFKPIERNFSSFDEIHPFNGWNTMIYSRERQDLYCGSLRSNCKITNQPDFGTVLVSLLPNQQTNIGLCEKSLMRFIMSLRDVNHFHEEICELIFNEIYENYAPEYLWVRCNYTRRGGIDINPTRYTSETDEFCATRMFNQ